MRDRLRTVARVAMVAALALLLTGCLKLDMDLAIQTDDTVDGSVVFAVNKDVLELTGGSIEDLTGGETPFPSDVEGVTTEDYDDGEFAGQQFSFDGVPIGVFASNTDDPDALSITREGDTFEVSGALDLTQGATGATGLGGAEQFFESAEIRIAITFPGEVIESNGTVDGNTVTWEPAFGERIEIQATGSAVEGASSSNTLLWVVIGLAVVALAVIVVVVVMMNRRKAPEAAAPEGAGIAVPMAEAAPTAPSDEVTPAAPAAEAIPAAPPVSPAPEPVAPAPPTPPEPAPEPPTAPEPPEPASGEPEVEGEGEIPPPPPPSGQA
jgi:hypothetical protein